MKKKKRLADLMEEDLMETTQKRIDELNAELKMLDEQCGKFAFTPYPITASILRCKQDLIELEYEQRRLRRGQERREHEARETALEMLDRLEREWDDRKNALLEKYAPYNALLEHPYFYFRREERERTKVQARAAEERERLASEAREDFLERSKWLVGKWNTPDGVLSFIDTDLDSGFYGQNGKTPFLCFTKSSEEDENRLQFEWDGKPIYATVDGETLLWDDGDTYTRHDEQKEDQRIQREQVKEKLAGQWETFEALALRGHENGNALFQDLDVYMPGSDTPYLWFVEIDLNGCLIYEYDDDQRILAWFDGDRDDVLKWSDGSIYRRGYDIDPDPELKTGGWASEDNAIDFERIENIAREPIPGAGNATTLPRDRGDDSTGAKEFATTRKFFQGDHLHPRASTLVDSMIAISQADLCDHPQCELNQVIHDAYQSVVQRDKESPMKTNSGGDTNISRDIQWEFLIKYYNDQGFGNSTAETTATCLGHYDKDQDVDTGVPYCFYFVWLL